MCVCVCVFFSLKVCVALYNHLEADSKNMTLLYVTMNFFQSRALFTYLES